MGIYAEASQVPLQRVDACPHFFVRWVMTDKFDPKSAEHVAIKKGIELGDGIEEKKALKDIEQSTLSGENEFSDLVT